ncbi:MAG: replication-associated recombination protein A [Elusimicrobia bacterium]|nr:replication-associated recombination protein A [Elusimicrobiota bacterium]
MPRDSLQGELFRGGQGLDSRPLAARMAPQSLDDFCGQEKILGPGRMLRRLIESKKFSSAIFFGPPGCGKTGLAAIVSRSIDAKVEAINAVAAGVADIKKALEAARYDLSLGKRTLLVVDEIHHFNRSQQDALLPAVERGEVMMIGLTTENPSFSVNAALLSRVTAFEFEPLSENDLKRLMERALKDETRGLGALKAELSPEAAGHLLRFSGGDARRLLNALELAVLSTAPVDGRRRVSLEVAEESIQRRQIRYDKKSDDHYDHISAFIKSMRGSDPDAALYWMAKMLAAGEDPRFIARRILICAAEDVGLADFRALLIADAVFRAVESLGMPEARIPLAEAAVYVAAAPKSNSAYLAVDAALSEVKTGPRREVPLHLRDANLDAASCGHGAGYKYAHDFPDHYVKQDYMPDPVRFYEPGNLGGEAEIKKRLDALRTRSENGGDGQD